jgi:hypothetical protein
MVRAREGGEIMDAHTRLGARVGDVVAIHGHDLGEAERLGETGSATVYVPGPPTEPSP